MRLFCIFLLIILISCSSNDPEKTFSTKTKVGVLRQTFGMVSYEVFLYSDGTFYLPTDVLKFSHGRYNIVGGTVSFKTKGGQKVLCDEYRLSDNQLTSSNCEPKDILFIEWYDD